MKKYILGIFCSLLFIVPSISFAKKVTCDNLEYKAAIEINKEKININDYATINIESEYNYNLEYKISDNNILKIEDNKIWALQEGKATIKAEIIFSETSSCNIDIPIEVVSNDSALKSLNLEELDISALFNPDKYEYEINLPYSFEKINIIAEANNINAKITGDGRRYLNDGENEYEVIVTATDGTISTYKIIINREAPNEDTTLKQLIVEGYVLSPKFDKDTFNYTLEVNNEVNEITINADTSYKYANVNGSGTFSLATGQNTFDVIVTAENGNKSKYEIIINKNKGESKLDQLEISDYILDSDFSSDKYIYYITINNNITQLDIKASSKDDDQIEIIGNENLKDGKNEIIIRVTGDGKSSTTYKIIANKLSIKEEQEIEKNDMLIKILLIIFVISIIIMATFIAIFLKRNLKKEKIKSNKVKNKKK